MAFQTEIARDLAREVTDLHEQVFGLRKKIQTVHDDLDKQSPSPKVLEKDNCLLKFFYRYAAKLFTIS